MFKSTAFANGEKFQSVYTVQTVRGNAYRLASDYFDYRMKNNNFDSYSLQVERIENIEEYMKENEWNVILYKDTSFRIRKYMGYYSASNGSFSMLGKDLEKLIEEFGEYQIDLRNRLAGRK